MVKLPPRVVWNRLWLRLLGSDSRRPIGISDQVLLLNRSLFSDDFFSKVYLDNEKWSFLLHRYLHDELNYLGTGWVSLNPSETEKNVHRYAIGSESIPIWNLEHRNNFDFNPKGSPPAEMSKAFQAQGIDVKWCWEFARLQHLPQLALASRLLPVRANDSLNKIRHHLASFVDQNPVGKGINWSSPMEAAIRLVNILLTFDIARDKLSDLEDLVTGYASDHWYFLYSNLEDKDGYGTNHYLANLMGLMVGGYYLKSSKIESAANWVFSEFEKELSKQFFEDGVNFEYSTYYHRLSTEISLITLHAASKMGYDISQRTLNTISKAVNNLSLLAKSDGHLPLFGDNDSGRIIELDPILDASFEPDRENSIFIYGRPHSSFLDQKFLKPILDQLPRPSETNLNSFRFSNLPTLRYYESWRIEYDPITINELRRHDFPNGGLHVFKSNDFYLAVNLMCNPRGHRYHGHMHNDKGAFELRVHNKNLVQDPGIYSYTANVVNRNRYRATRVHPVPDTGIEQNRFLQGPLGLFHMKLEVQCKLLELWEKGLTVQIEYRGVQHVRKFEIFSDHLSVEDWCNKSFTVNKKPDVPIAPGYGKTL
jgi:hypothetical protein